MWVAVGSGTNSIAYSYNGLSWFSAYNSLGIFNYEGLCITWNGTMWVAGGAGTTNTMAYSYDGINWIGLGFVFKDFCKRIEWNGTTLCAVGGGISRVTFNGTTDGTLRNNTATFKAICCSPSGQYVYALSATGTDGTLTAVILYRSSDYGITWNNTGTGGSTSVYLNSVSCSRDGKYVFFGLSNAGNVVIWSSSNYGVNFGTLNISLSGSTTGIWLCCSGDGSILHIVGNALYSRSSNYGTSYTTSSSINVSGVSTALGLLKGIACSQDGKYVIIIRSTVGTDADIYISSDYGVNWVSTKPINSATYTACCMSPSGQYMFVASSNIGLGLGFYVSTNYGLNWANVTTTLKGVSACCSSDFKYILTCDSSTTNKLVVSTNFGSSFTDVSDNSTVTYSSVSCSSDFTYLYYISSGSVYSKSINAMSVSTISSGTIYPGMIISGTGVTTNTRIVSGSKGSLGVYNISIPQKIASSTTLSGTSSSIAYSTDGLNWTNNMTSVLANQGNGVGWNGNTWLSSGIGSSVFSASVGGTVQPMLTISSMSYGTIYPGLNITGGTIASNTFISNGNVTFTGSISGTTLTVTSTSGTISVGMVISGTGIITRTLISSGSLLTWTVSISQTVSSTTITGTHPGTGTSGTYYLTTTQSTSSTSCTTGGITSITGTVSGTILTVTALTLTGLISIGMVLTGTNIASNTFVTAFISGTGRTGTYRVSVDNLTQSTGFITGTLTTTFALSAPINSGSNILTASTPTVGVIFLGMVLTGDVRLNTVYISGYGTGSGGAGTYILSSNISITVEATTILTGNFISSTFTGAISGSTLNVTNLALGSIYVGSILSSENCLGSTYISSFVSGTNGGIGVYTVNVLQSVASQTITATGLASASNTMAYSTDAITWTSLSSNIFREGYGVSWNGKMWVVGGSGTTSSLIYSYDTLYWFGLGTNTFSKCYNLFWNGCKWIACGESTNKLAFANDTGTNWKSITSPFTTNCLDIAYNFKRENRITLPKRLNIMLGSGTNNIQYSYSEPTSFNSPMTWTAVSSPFTASVRSADYNGTLFVAGGEGQNTMAYSYDGLTWVGLGISTFSTICNFVKWNGSMWLAGGKGLSASFIGRIDGTTLTVLSNFIGKLVVGMTITGSTIYANTTITGILSPSTYTVSSSQNIAQTYISASTSTGVISYSYDGLTWITSSTTFFTTSAQWADWNGKIWVCVGTGTNTIGYSTDGINWFSSDTGTILTNSFTVKWNGKIWVAGGSQICYSSDSITWYSTTSPFTGLCYSVEWNENIWVAGGWGGTPMAYSIDGITWVSVTSPAFTERCYGVYWNGSYWLAGGQGGYSYAHSLDGIRWSAASNIFGTQGYSAISTKKSGSLYIQHPLVAVGSGSNHTLSYSSNDGLTFTGLGTSIFPVKSTSSCWNGKLWVAGGVSNTATFLASNLTPNITTLTVSEMLYDYPTLNPSVSAWGSNSAIFSQGTTAQQPTFDLTTVNFVATSSKCLSNSTSLPLNINSNGGFTSIVYVKFSGTPGVNYERVFDFGFNGSNSDFICLSRDIMTSNLAFLICQGTTQNLVTTTTSPIIQETWMTIGCRYTVGGGSSAMQLFKNKSLIISGGIALVPLDRTTTFNNIGRSYLSGNYLTGSIGGLLVYDRALSDSELNTATDALVNKTLNFSTTNLKVRLLVMPNSGKIYPGMTLTGSGITSNTKITTGPTTGAIGTYKITSSSNVSTNTIVNASSSSLAYSYDALSWIPLGNSIFSNVCNNITWTGSQFVAVGEGTVSFVGSISTTTLTVTSVLIGTIYVGMTIYGSGITAITKITAFVSGIGSVGTYTVSQSQTISSQIMNGTPITVAYSTDGINWTPTQNQISSGADSVIYDGQKAVVSSTGFTSFIGRIDNGTGSASGNTLTVSEVLYDYPIANPSVNRWNTFSQNTFVNQPTFDGTSVNFNRTNSHTLANNSLTLNIQTNGGFTAIAYVKFSGSVGSNSSERIFEFANVTSGTSDNIILCRNGTGSAFFAALFSSTTQHGNLVSSTGDIIQEQWMTVSLRYTGSTLQIYKNKTQIAVNNSMTIPSNRTTIYNNIGKSNSNVGDSYFNGSIGGLLVYDRALSDTELNNATDALVNKTLNFPIDNLKVRLLIMNPNPSLIYPGMRISGAGITDGTTISSYGTGSGGVGTYTVSGSSQTITPALTNASNVNISSSTDLVTWTGSGTTNLPALGINGIAYNGNRYVAVGGGIVSFAGSLAGTILTVSVVYSGSLYIGMTIYASGVTNTLITAYGTGSGGVGTYNVTVSQTVTVRTIYGNPITMAYSSDLSTWSPVTNTQFTNQGNSVSWNGRTMVAVGDGTDDILYSSDGVSWTPVSNSNTLLSPNPNSVSWTGKKWIACGPVTNSSSFTCSISGTTLLVGSVSGFTYHIYSSGYFNDDPTWFSSRVESSTGLATDMSTINLSTGTIVPNSGWGLFSVKWDGYFYATTTETYTFYTNTDDASYLWIGTNALSGYTTSNCLVNNGGGHPTRERSGTISLVAGTYYPILIQFGEGGGGYQFVASFSTPTISKTSNFSGYVFSFSSINSLKVGMLISGTGVSPGTKIVSGTDSPYTVNISQSVSSTTMTGASNASVYSYDGVNWSDMGTSSLITSQCNGIIGNPRVGTVVVDSQSVIDGYGAGLTDSFELVSDKYYNNDYNTFSVSISSNQV